MRWTFKIKARYAERFVDGTLTLRDIRRAGISLPEVRSWALMWLDHGNEALKTTKLQNFRPRLRP
jgi:hypothetical protein